MMHRSHVLLPPFFSALVAGLVCTTGVRAESPDIREWREGNAEERLQTIILTARLGTSPSERERTQDWLTAVSNEGIRDEDHASSITADLWWVRLDLKNSHTEADAGDVLDELATRARNWNLARQEAEIFTFWAEVLETEGRWRHAMKAFDFASQAALSENRLSAAVRSLIEMARLCRENAHPWLLQHMWVRIDATLADAKDHIDLSTQERLNEERAAGESLISPLPALPVTFRGASLLPKDAATLVSAPDGELGRVRFTLTNASAAPLNGTLTVSGEASNVSSWSSSTEGQTATLTAAANPVAATRTLTVPAGGQVPVYIERILPGREDAVSLSWTDATGMLSEKAHFFFRKNQRSVSMVNNGIYHVQPGWPIPIYQEMNNRAVGHHIQDLQFATDMPCRLEIFDVDDTDGNIVDPGRLLAIDAEGDGYFSSPADALLSDHSADGTSDIIIGRDSRCLEIHVWPLVRLAAGQSITLRSRLRTADGSWAPSAINEIKDR